MKLASKIFQLSLLTLLTMTVAASGFAGILVSNNSTGLIKGSTEVDETSPLGAIFGATEADVDWSVFAPGTDFQTFLGENSLSLTEGFSATNYVYVYQLFNINSLEFGFEAGVVQLTVGMDVGDLVVPGAVGALGTTDLTDVIPDDSSYAGTAPNDVTSAVWAFQTTNAVGNGDQSGLLYFASPSPPEFDNVTLNAGSLIVTDYATGASGPPSGPGVPSPGIPEPSTIFLGLLCGSAFAVTRFRSTK